MKIKAPRVPIVDEKGVLTRDGLAFINSLEDRISDLEALIQVLTRPLDSVKVP
jgi:hypothetical protein